MKRLSKVLIESQTLQVFFGTTKGDGVAQGARSGDIIDDLVLRTAQKLVVEKLKVLFLGERYFHQIFNMLDFVYLDAIALEHPLVIGRMGLQVSQSLM